MNLNDAARDVVAAFDAYMLPSRDGGGDTQDTWPALLDAIDQLRVILRRPQDPQLHVSLTTGLIDTPARCTIRHNGILIFDGLAAESLMGKGIEHERGLMMRDSRIRQETLRDVATWIEGPSEIPLDAATCRYLAEDMRRRADPLKYDSHEARP
jgi:hypothetical protein